MCVLYFQQRDEALNHVILLHQHQSIKLFYLALPFFFANKILNSNLIIIDLKIFFPLYKFHYAYFIIKFNISK